METWNLTETGTIYHSFKADGSAVCRINVKVGAGREAVTEDKVDAIVEASLMITVGYRKCASCSKKEALYKERSVASMKASDGEGDYLPPAEEAPVKAQQPVCGPLIAREVKVIEQVSRGMRYAEIGDEQGFTPAWVSAILQGANVKLETATTAETVATYNRAKGYFEAADLVERDVSQLRRNAAEGSDVDGMDVDFHVANVLESLAEILRNRARAMLLPL